MCLLVFSYNCHPIYKFILAANRDEFYSRPTQPAQFWGENNSIFSGRDVEAGGTWLGVNKNGRIAALTNYRDIRNMKIEAPSRGIIVSDFLSGKTSADVYAKKLTESGNKYNGFNLIFGDLNSVFYFNSVSAETKELNSGIYSLSNHLLNSPWPKSQKINSLFNNVISRKKFSAAGLFEILTDTEIFDDNLLPDTGLAKELERAVSPIFVVTPAYGTRSSAVVLIDKENNLFFEEHTYDESGKIIQTTGATFKIAAE
ncbi:MAG: hypothetical protein AUK34_14695 [Ignavibacteria bacterium CG2_30_36_16]|nr:NRDE family protein [Ignavibacteria bacterium]OIP54786.1 MAG: hypothetical protein AUK34_14695 [Ignavibacteria bacterium CG2_30_36_16]PJB01210.1 MAG: hypothetical protein CO127_05020 [Ignavibacteria bacterium CG_4_9_14_3_um_filter_36_18]